MPAFPYRRNNHLFPSRQDLVEEDDILRMATTRSRWPGYLPVYDVHFFDSRARFEEMKRDITQNIRQLIRRLEQTHYITRNTLGNLTPPTQMRRVVDVARVYDELSGHLRVRYNALVEHIRTGQLRGAFLGEFLRWYRRHTIGVLMEYHRKGEMTDFNGYRITSRYGWNVQYPPFSDPDPTRTAPWNDTRTVQQILTNRP